ncbi:single-stranded-DNA-specific exonuclease RecJ [Elizabethkingia argentiflava]|uniref:Single-stranded-DNA-specific exonuclease RecJ n=1 Tax=Elizabethkingia argenteiflava TaxID=2681556 RepID=A0A845PU41_9FLAO|nr:single-stranded-DNA-specific exonuclease RecJ [Elizabethkingia argenteiflava]NAW49997.1 single-stranded-DNA-specific exonuclease RecJ [Elizabethkingia argenteiflava]
MTQRWIYKQPPAEDRIDSISSSLGFGPLAAKILVMRGIDSYQKAREFFKPKLSDIHDPFLMADMHKAVERIAEAIENGEKILVFGDYDVDGTTAVSLLYLYLSRISNKKYLDFYIPDRNLEGYGVSSEGIDYANNNGFSLIIALDCGIKSIDKIEYANGLGIDFIICDHHLPGDVLPPAKAVLDPKRNDCLYPYKDLSGCGVGYKLCQALNTLYKIPEQELQDLTDLLVISIAADIVPITGENRVFAKMGLNKLRKTKRHGLKILIPPEKLRNFSISNIVFEIAPKINAAGRISHGKAAVELMTAENTKQAYLIANKIVNLNDERKELDSNMTQQAIDQVIETQQENTYSTVVYQSGWNKGVIGIVASRLIELYYKPTLVFTDGNEGEVVASARSVADFDLHQALDSCADLFLKFGGHRAAAGLSMEKKHFSQFKKRFEETVKVSIKEHQKSPSIEIDAEISLQDLNHDFFQFHRWLAPFGPENMKPILVLKNVRVKGYIKKMGKQNSHLKFNIIQEQANKEIECLAFKMGDYASDFRNRNFDIAVTLEENYWKDSLTYYLNIKDVIFH